MRDDEDPKAETHIQEVWRIGPVVYVPHYLAGVSVPLDTFVGPGSVPHSAQELKSMGAQRSYRALWARPNMKEIRR